MYIKTLKNDGNKTVLFAFDFHCIFNPYNWSQWERRLFGYQNNSKNDATWVYDDKFLIFQLLFSFVNQSFKLNLFIWSSSHTHTHAQKTTLNDSFTYLSGHGCVEFQKRQVQIDMTEKKKPDFNFLSTSKNQNKPVRAYLDKLSTCWAWQPRCCRREIPHSRQTTRN